MRTVITLAILLLVATSAQAMDPAPAIEWERLYNLGTSTSITFIAETTDGGFITTMTVVADTVFSLHRLSHEGDILWTAGSDLFYQKGNTALELVGGDFIVAGYGKDTESSSIALMIGKYDEVGNEIWTKLYNSSYPGAEAANSICQLPDGGFAVCGGIAPAGEQNQAWILRTDAQGDTLWTREWGWVYNDSAKEILYIDNGLTVLMHGSTPTTSGGPHLVRYDLDGNMLWETALDFPETGPAPGAQAMCRASDGGLLVMDHLTPDIVHFDLLGNYDWHFNPPGWNNNWGLFIDTTMDGGIIFGGKNEYQPPGKSISENSGMISRHDSLGNELWRDYVYNSGCIEINSVRQLSQGGYIAAGRGSGQGLLIRYAPETGIESGDVSPAVKITSVSPNPFSSSLSITCSLPEQMSASINVYGLDGRIVDVVEAGAFPAGEHTVSWIPSPEFASGCYLIRLQTEVGTDVRNCVLLEN